MYSIISNKAQGCICLLKVTIEEDQESLGSAILRVSMPVSDTQSPCLHEDLLKIGGKLVFGQRICPSWGNFDPKLKRRIRIIPFTRPSLNDAKVLSKDYAQKEGLYLKFLLGYPVIDLQLNNEDGKL